jgi:hypothetical protein
MISEESEANEVQNMFLITEMYKQFARCKIAEVSENLISWILCPLVGKYHHDLLEAQKETWMVDELHFLLPQCS